MKADYKINCDVCGKPLGIANKDIAYLCLVIHISCLPEKIRNQIRDIRLPLKKETGQ